MADQEGMSPLIQKWLDLGFCLIPTGKDKVASESWKEYQLKKPSEAEIKRWFSSNERNVAVVCGAISGNMVCLDNDDPKIADLTRLNTLTIRTPGLGLHQYVISKKVPAKIQSFNGYALDIQGEKAYALLPPSKTEKGEYVIVNDIPIQVFDDILEYLNSKLPKIRTKQDKNIEKFKQLVGTAIIEKWVKKEHEGHKYWQGLCPFHKETKPSFTVYPDGYHCFGCGEHGDVIDFVMKAERLDFKQSVLKLSDLLGVNAPAFKPQQKESYHLTDLGNAQRLISQHGEDLRYNHVWNKWLVWNGKYWEIDNTAEVYQKAKQTIKKMYAEASSIEDEQGRKALAKHAMACEANHKIKAMLELAESEESIPVLPEQFDTLDTNQWLLNVENGTIDLKTGKLREHRREDYITKIAPVVYDPKAGCPLWLAFLKKIFKGNEKLIKFMKRAVGYALTGNTKEQCFFILWGIGKNGKSTFLNVIFMMLGDYALQTSAETILIKRYGGGIPNDIARLRGARYVTAIESEEGKRLAEALIKQLTGRDMVSARFLHGEFFDFEPEFKLFLGTNHKPIIRGTDNAIWERIKLIPFTVFIPPEERDKDLSEKLKGELSGILNWALEGCLEWQKSGLDIPDDVLQATEEYRIEMDVLGEFLQACCELDINAVIPNKMLYQAYQLWCGAENEKADNHISFSRKIEERGFQKERINKGMAWHGIRLKQEIIEMLSRVNNETDNSVGYSVGCRLMKVFRGFFTCIPRVSKNTEKPTQTYTTYTNREKIDLVCKQWESKHQTNINSENCTKATFDLKPQFPDLTADELANHILRYAKLTPETKPEQVQPQSEQAGKQELRAMLQKYHQHFTDAIKSNNIHVITADCEKYLKQGRKKEAFLEYFLFMCPEHQSRRGEVEQAIEELQKEGELI